jgi:hypothetical protein
MDSLRVTQDRLAGSAWCQSDVNRNGYCPAAACGVGHPCLGVLRLRGRKQRSSKLQLGRDERGSGAIEKEA